MPSEIKLQALKENVETVEVNEVKISEGDVVSREQPLLEVQADKASLPVPSPVAGRVVKVLVKPGDEIKIGQVYCVIDSENGAGQPAAPEKKEPEKKEPEKKEPEKKEPERKAAEKKEPEKRTEDKRGDDRPAEPMPVGKKGGDNEPPAHRPPSRIRAEDMTPGGGQVIPAGPATRRLARELGVDLRQVSGSGRGGRVTPDDVRGYVRVLASGGGPAAGGPVQAPPLPDFAQWGEVEVQPLRGIRKATARQMSLAWSLVPHVTQHDLADITELETFRKEQTGKGMKLTVTAFALKAAVIALRQYPQLNASLDTASGKLILKRYYHLGVAVDTDNGLLVPVLRDVDRKSVFDLARELTEIAERARKGQVGSEDMTGGTFTITNLGGIGGTAFTPIVNWPEVAILGLSRSRWQPVVLNGQVVPRLMMPLSLSYDHRVVDGADAARFTRAIADLMENPKLMLLHA